MARRNIDVEKFSIDDLVRMAEEGTKIDTEKRVVVKKLAQYSDDDYYEIYETSYTDDGNIILEIVPSTSHYGRRVKGWRVDE